MFLGKGELPELHCASYIVIIIFIIIIVLKNHLTNRNNYNKYNNHKSTAKNHKISSELYVANKVF